MKEYDIASGLIIYVHSMHSNIFTSTFSTEIGA